ncbi:MAG: DUF4405 domain-containing protein [Chloroflexi bacterium]|nr:DUF4405 domain-containing protein [Chloroflexota bacterium]
MSDNQEANSGGLFKRFAESMNRGAPMNPSDDRGRMKQVMDNLVLHLHPAKVAKPSIKFTYTWGLGGLALLLLVILVITGVMLMFVYTPDPEHAYQDMLNLKTDVWFGQFMRNLHHWSGNALVVVTLLHLLRVMYTGALSRPREFNWILGVSLLVLVVVANFTGYLLPWDQLAYWAVTVGVSLLQYVPLVGDELAYFILGGPEVGAATLTNFYGLHLAIVPLLIMGILSFHLFRARKDGFSIPRKIGEAQSERVERITTIPHLVSREFIFALAATAVLVVWAILIDAPLEEAADPNHSPNPAKAAWYFMGIQELLLHFHPIFAAIIMPAVGLTMLALLPYMEHTKDGEGVWFHSKHGRRLAVLGLITGFVGTTLLVIADEYYINLPEQLPSLPTIISNGWVPFAWTMAGLWLYWELLRGPLKAAISEARQSMFTLILTGFVVLTIIGVFFRGEGMALDWPW